MLTSMNLQNLALRPNCLLTQSQLVFVPGLRSLFFYENPYGQLPDFLFAHGYSTLTLSLPFRHLSRRRKAFEDWLKQNKEKQFHFILDEGTYQEFSSLLVGSQIKSITVTCFKGPSKIANNLYSFKMPNSILNWIRTPFSFRIHQSFHFIQGRKVGSYGLLFCNANRITYDRFLDHCIKLAENEIYA